MSVRPHGGPDRRRVRRRRVAAIALATFLSGSDAATKGLDLVAGLGVTAFFAATGLPALILAWRGQSPRTALALSLAFPLAVIAAVAAIAVSLP